MLLVLADGRLLEVDEAGVVSTLYSLMHLQPDNGTVEVEEAYYYDEDPMIDPMETFWETEFARHIRLDEDYFWGKLYNLAVLSAYDRIPWTKLS